MWSKARCVAAFANRLGDEATVEVEFKKPIFLPGSVAFGSRVVEFDTTHGLDFSLTNPGNGAPHLVGRGPQRPEAHCVRGARRIRPSWATLPPAGRPG